MRSAFLTTITCYLLFLGFSFPFIAALAYIWIDIVKPQELAYSVITGLPLGLIAALLTALSYLINNKEKLPKFGAVMALLCFFAAWITLTTWLADPRILSWDKWDWAFKVVVFTVFIPFIFQSRTHIECLILAIIFSVSTIAFSAGVKTALGSGGYGVLAIMGSNNTGLSEGSTLATVGVMTLPLIHFVYRHSIVFAHTRYFKPIILAIACTIALAVIGTNARTGLITGLLLLVIYVLRSKRKLLWILLILAAAGIASMKDLSNTAWGNRMSTINSYEKESSALGRIRVWQWTLGFVAENPLGGGFDAFKLNRIAAVKEDGNVYYDPGVVRGKAFHNIFFEVLGEQGIVGFATYITVILLTFVGLANIRKQCRDRSELAWASDLALRLRDALAILLTGGMFIGIAYQSYIFYLIAMSVVLSQLIVKDKQAVLDVNNI